MIFKHRRILKRVKQHISFPVKKCNAGGRGLIQLFIQIRISHLLHAILDISDTVADTLFQILIVFTVHDQTCRKKSQEHGHNHQQTGMV